MPRRNQHSREQLRDLALDAVQQIAERDGPQQVSARKVAQEIGYAPGMLYHLFENIDDLILQANARTIASLTERLARAVAHKAPQQAVLMMARDYLSLARQNSRRWQLLFEHSMRNDAPVPDWYQHQTDALFKLVEAQLQGLAPEKPRAEITLAARSLWSAVHGVCLLAVTGKLDVGGTVEAGRLVDSLVTNYLRGWKASA